MAIHYPNCWVAMKVVFDGLGGADSNILILDDVQPLDATVHCNGYNMADTFEVGFNANLLPFSPELIRAMAVDVYMFDAPKLLGRDEVGAYLVKTNRMIHGMMDEHSTDYGMQGRSVRVSGRDLTCILADEPWPPTQTITVGDDLVSTVQSMIDLAQHGNGERMIATWSDDLPAPTVSGIGQGITTKSNAAQVKAERQAAAAAARKGKPPRKKPTTTGRSRTTRTRAPVLSGRSYWDAISELCLEYGCLCYVQDTLVVIRPPQSMSDETADQIVRLAYGRNLSDLQVKRHHGREAAPQIVSSYYDAKAKQFVEVKFPTTDKAWIMANAGVQKASSSSASSSVNYRRILMPPGIRDQSTALAVCEAAYNTYGRSEASMIFQTKALKDSQGLSLMNLRPGNPVSVSFDDDIYSAELRNLFPSERRAALRGLGYSDQVAAIVAQNYDRLDHLRVARYTKEVTFHYDHGEGIDVSVDAINFVAPPRDDASNTENPLAGLNFLGGSAAPIR